jgi:hypothetical protein
MVIYKFNYMYKYIAIALFFVLFNYILSTGKDDIVIEKTTNVATPVEMLVKSGQYGFLYLCGIRANKKVECLGWNNFGQIGNTSSDEGVYFAIVEVENVKNVSQLKVGWFHSCAVHDENVSCWGLNVFNQASTKGYSISSPPSVLFSDFNQIDKLEVGLFHSCVSSKDATSCHGFILFRQMYLAIRDFLGGIYEIISHVYNQVYDMLYNVFKIIYRRLKSIFNEIVFIPVFFLLALLNTDPYFYAPFVFVLFVCVCVLKFLIVRFKRGVELK